MNLNKFEMDKFWIVRILLPHDGSFEVARFASRPTTMQVNSVLAKYKNYFDVYNLWELDYGDEILDCIVFR